MSTELNFHAIQKEIGIELLSIKIEQRKWNENQKYKDVSFSDFIFALDDFYLFAYGNKMKRSTWQVFDWIRYMTRADGFARVSYQKLINTFCRDGEKISQPTFHKAVDELINLGLVVKIKTRKEFDGKYQNGDNVYAVVNMTDIVYQMCDLNLHNNMLTPFECYNQVTGIEVIKQTPKPQPKNVSTGDKRNDSKKLKIVMLKFAKIKKVVDNFFTFLGSYNASGKISPSRKLDILTTLKDEYLTIGFDLNDVKYAMNKTMSNTVNIKSKNYKREKYMFAILNSQIEYEDEVVVENEVAEKLSKEASDEVKKETYKNFNAISEIEYKEHIKKLSSVTNYHMEIINMFKDNTNELEHKLFQIATLIDKKIKDINEHKKYSVRRIDYLFENGIAELVEYDSKWNRSIEWVYDKNDEPVPFDVIKQLRDNNKEVFNFSKYDKLDRKDELDV